MIFIKYKEISFLFLMILLISTVGCFRFLSDTVVITPRMSGGKAIYIETTGYCSCQKCCGWKRNWRYQPVFASGPNKGKVKKVGMCADGTMARHGTLAADTRYFPFGTQIKIPGYGMGTVHDRGGAIKGSSRLDLFFESHQEALEWGRKTIKVVVYKNK